MILFRRSKNHGSIPVNFAIESTLKPLRKDASKAQSRVSVAVKSIGPPDCQDGSSQSVERFQIRVNGLLYLGRLQNNDRLP